MKILAVNCGSSSLKFQAYEMPEEKVLIQGTFERIGIDGGFYTIKLNKKKIIFTGSSKKNWGMGGIHRESWQANENSSTHPKL